MYKMSLDRIKCLVIQRENINKTIPNLDFFFRRIIRIIPTKMNLLRKINDSAKDLPVVLRENDLCDTPNMSNSKLR